MTESTLRCIPQGRSALPTGLIHFVYYMGTVALLQLPEGHFGINVE
jgi:hypothetical protein